jgi:AbrB family looped-hinge helix DNA binding protein
MMSTLQSSPETTRPETSLRAKVRLSSNGRIVIPAEMRKALGVKPGETILLEVEDGVLRMESFQSRVRHIQAEFAKYIKPGVLLSDELIADRREEARREMEEFEQSLGQSLDRKAS